MRRSTPIQTALVVLLAIAACTGADDETTPEMESGEDGTVTEEIAVPPLDALWVRAGSYSVRVHERGGSDHGPAVACATL